MLPAKFSNIIRECFELQEVETIEADPKYGWAIALINHATHHSREKIRISNKLTSPARGKKCCQFASQLPCLTPRQFERSSFRAERDMGVLWKCAMNRFVVKVMIEHHASR